MSEFLKQLKWQVILLHKNNIITISFVVTIIYGLILYFLKDSEYINQVLVALVLNDPSVIGYFFIALAIYTEIKTGVLSALLVTPINIHSIIISKVFSLSIIGSLCSLVLVISVKGLDFHFISYSLGSLIICIQAALLGFIVLTFASEFLSFAIRSIPIFFLFTGATLLDYLSVWNLGIWKYLFPVQGSLDLIDHAISQSHSFTWLGLLPTFIWTILLYAFAYQLFTRKFVYQ
jgi:fluoroquinolone transport system permease protein